ncbi:MAG: tetratricopeptide repeat protein [Flavobacteriales bacterium]|nr:tetratricopeptide repeat protein [Flavobacteriales bacterium]
MTGFRYLYSILIVICLLGGYGNGAAGAVNTDSLENALSLAADDSLKLTILSRLAAAYKSSTPDKVIEYGERGLELARTMKWGKETGNFLNTIGIAYTNKGNLARGKRYFKKSLLEYGKIDDQQGMLNNFNNLGIVCFYQGDYESAIASFLESLEISEEIGDTAGIANSMNNIGSMYEKQQDYDKALEYYQQALTLRDKIGDRKGVAGCYNNLGIVYKRKEEYDKALSHYFKSLKIKEELDEAVSVAETQHNIGIIYQYRKEYNIALEYYLKSMNTLKKMGDKRRYTHNLVSIGSLLQDQNKYQEAIEYFEQARQNAKEIGSLPLLRESLGALYKCQSMLKNFKQAFYTLQEHTKIKDSIFNADNTKRLAEIETKYETEKKERELLEKDVEISSQKVNLASQKSQAEQQRILTLAVASILALVIVFSVLLYRRFRVSQRQQQIIAGQKAIVDEKNKDITDSINYAKRIQTAMLRSDEEMQALLGDHFVLFLPKDVVSGDFYWCHDDEEVVIWVVADCTGHGVPGAFMSMIGNSLMNEIIIEKKLRNPGQILDALKAGIINSLGIETQDGMDMSLCTLNRKTNELQFAGANNGIYIVREGIGSAKLSKENGIVIFNNDLIELKPDKQSVGYEQAKENPFTTRSVYLEKGDKIYAYSDGYVDQFGGRKNKKYSARRFKIALSGFNSLTMKEQGGALANILKDWQTDREQIDDICVIGVTV